MPTSPSPRSERLGTPNPPAIRFTRGKYFGASRFTHLLRPAKLLASLYGSDRYARPSEAFTSRLSTDRLPSPLLDMTTTATGLLCWRNSHPLECQLASLHQILTGLFLQNNPLSSYLAKALIWIGWESDRNCGATREEAARQEVAREEEEEVSRLFEGSGRTICRTVPCRLLANGQSSDPKALCRLGCKL